MSKTITIECDYCKKSIPQNVIYGVLQMPAVPEVNFCGYFCFDDWIINFYLKNREKNEPRN